MIMYLQFISKVIGFRVLIVAESFISFEYDFMPMIRQVMCTCKILGKCRKICTRHVRCDPDSNFIHDR